jgi:tRNA (cytosine38-C5)-methyltransferase
LDGEERVWRHIPGLGEDWVDERISGVNKSDAYVAPLSQYLDLVGENDKSKAMLLSIPDLVLEKWGRLFDIVLPSTKRTCCFTRGRF